jgi:hypothetical protein
MTTRLLCSSDGAGYLAPVKPHELRALGADVPIRSMSHLARRVPLDAATSTESLGIPPLSCVGLMSRAVLYGDDVMTRRHTRFSAGIRVSGEPAPWAAPGSEPAHEARPALVTSREMELCGRH